MAIFSHLWPSSPFIVLQQYIMECLKHPILKTVKRLFKNNCWTVFKRHLFCLLYIYIYIYIYILQAIKYWNHLMVGSCTSWPNKWQLEWILDL